VTQHASLTAERWARFSLDKQVLMIANEMRRTSALQGSADRASLERTYERVLRLTDLTAAVQPKLTLRRELLRRRDLIAPLFVDARTAPASHAEALRPLLLLRPAAARQTPLLFG
jgi:hypothetical protein